MKPLSEANKVKLKELNSILKEFVNVGVSIERKYPISHDVSEFLMVRFNLFSRFIHYTESITILAEHYDVNPTIDSSIGIILRSGLSDYLPMIYLDNLQTKKNKSKKVEQQTRAFLADHLSSAMLYLKQGARLVVDYNGNPLTDVDFRKALRRLKKDYFPYFKKTKLNYISTDSNLKYKKIQIRLFEIVDEMVLEEKSYKDGHRNKNFLQQMDAQSAYESYHWYSKYDHYGIFTNDFQTQDMDMLFRLAFSGIRFMLIGAVLCLSHMQHNYKDVDVNQEQKQMAELFQKYYHTLTGHKN